MARPKGSKNKPTTSNAVASVVIPVAQPEANPLNFTEGQWYKFDDERIMMDTQGRVFRWSVIKFEVIKVNAGIVAVRFEDGSFEAMVDVPISSFVNVKAPKY